MVLLWKRSKVNFPSPVRNYWNGFSKPRGCSGLSKSPKLTSGPTRKNKEINSITDAWEGSRCSLRGAEAEHLRFPLTPDLSCLPALYGLLAVFRQWSLPARSMRNSPFPSLSVGYIKKYSVFFCVLQSSCLFWSYKIRTTLILLW